MAAGGFKTFVAGEILTAADTNSFLMQGMLVFADATARDAAITSPVEGQFAFLKDDDIITFYNGTAWEDFKGLPDNFGPAVEFVVVAGGGGTPLQAYGGGGAGGYRSNFASENTGGGLAGEQLATIPLATSVTVTVGGGGSGGSNGSNSVFNKVVSIGGARSVFNGNGVSGGSGSGGSSRDAGSRPGGPGTFGQGFAGGTGNGVGGVGSSGGGGGGAAAVGGNGIASGNIGGNGGAGVASSITGTSVTRGGGGGGFQNSTGGAGGGGNPANNGTANTGGGAGGNEAGARNGGSGVVILRYPDSVTLTIGAGLTSSTASASGFKVTTFTAGTGTITANL